jgi:hypothetical protein
LTTTTTNSNNTEGDMQEESVSFILFEF